MSWFSVAVIAQCFDVIWTVCFVFEGTLHNSGLVSTHYEISERNFIDKTDAKHT